MLLLLLLSSSSVVRLAVDPASASTAPSVVRSKIRPDQFVAAVIAWHVLSGQGFLACEMLIAELCSNTLLITIGSVACR